MSNFILKNTNSLCIADVAETFEEIRYRTKTILHIASVQNQRKTRYTVHNGSLYQLCDGHEDSVR